MRATAIGTVDVRDCEIGTLTIRVVGMKELGLRLKLVLLLVRLASWVAPKGLTVAADISSN